MKRKSSICLIVCLAFFFSQISVFSSTRGKKIRSSIEKGVYIPADLVKMRNMQKLPIPASNDDYAFLQSIGKRSNIVIGNFKSGERVITLITDKDGDEKVDRVAHWFIDLNRIDVIPDPQKYCDTKKFLKYKEEIINGNSETLSPNPEGLSYLKVLIRTPSKVSRLKHGFKVFAYDTDEPSKLRVSYYFSDNGVHGVDLAFQVRYYNVKIGRVSPIINYAVYCKDSYDPYITNKVKKIIEETKKYYYD
ncbi:MAG: hypothetical protein SVR08_01510 [Spirochaetota bacterium]|nr:hypothetical protein [Spirochaetota bacterium]